MYPNLPSIDNKLNLDLASTKLSCETINWYLSILLWYGILNLMVYWSRGQFLSTVFWTHLLKNDMFCKLNPMKNWPRDQYTIRFKIPYHSRIERYQFIVSHDYILIMLRTMDVKRNFGYITVVNFILLLKNFILKLSNAIKLQLNFNYIKLVVLLMPSQDLTYCLLRGGLGT
jgi:hypothetical protein